MDRKKRYVQIFNKSWELDYFFANISNKVICLICGFQPSTVKKFLIERHFNNQHSLTYSNYTPAEKFNIIEGLKLVYEEGFKPFSSSSTNDSSQISHEAPSSSNEISSKKSLQASYAISLLIAQNSKPFTEGAFIKNCIVETVKAFGNSLTMDEAMSLSLSAKSISSRVTDINNSVKDKLKNLLQSSKYFSLCIDESTDIRHTSQLSIFTRIVQDDFSCVEELLDFVSLHNTTTGLDIFLAVEESLKKFNVDFNKCSSITTDGAKVMTGSKIGFVGQLTH